MYRITAAEHALRGMYVVARPMRWIVLGGFRTTFDSSTHKMAPTESCVQEYDELRTWTFLRTAQKVIDVISVSFVLQIMQACSVSGGRISATSKKRLILGCHCCYLSIRFFDWRPAFVGHIWQWRLRLLRPNSCSYFFWSKDLQTIVHLLPRVLYKGDGVSQGNMPCHNRWGIPISLGVKLVTGGRSVRLTNTLVVSNDRAKTKARVIAPNAVLQILLHLGIMHYSCLEMHDYRLVRNSMKFHFASCL